MTLDKYTELIKQWHKDNRITVNGNSITQTVKLGEEYGELCSGIIRGKKDLTADSLFDIWVVLVAIAELENIDIYQAFADGWDEIKHRKGFLTKQGNFVKSTDPEYEKLLKLTVKESDITEDMV